MGIFWELPTVITGVLSNEKFTAAHISSGSLFIVIAYLNKKKFHRIFCGSWAGVSRLSSLGDYALLVDHRDSVEALICSFLQK